MSVTLQLDPALVRRLEAKAIASQRSVSDLVSEALRLMLLEDESDLAAVEDRRAEPSEPFSSVAARLRADAGR